MKKSIGLLILFLLSFFIAHSQKSKEFIKRYNLAKDYYNAKQYPQATKFFKDLTTPHENNSVVEYAYFYQALCAYQQEKYLDSKFVLKQLLQKYPDWNKKEDVYYLLADIYFQLKEYKEAFAFSDTLQDAKLKRDASTMKQYHLRQIEDVAVLKEMEHTLKDEKIAEILARKLDQKYNSVEDKMLLEYLIQDYHLDRTKYPNGTFRANKKKDQYNVAVLLPFMLNESKSYRKYARFYELYQGIRLAADTLLKKGIVLNLFVYDTQKDTTRLKELLSHNEMEEMDLFIGPVYQQTSEMMKHFATIHRINYINPLQDDGGLIEETENVFLVKPSNEVKGLSFANYTNHAFPKKDVIVFYGEQEQDSVLAHTYIANLDQEKKRVVSLKKITKKNAIDIRKIINNADQSTLSNIFIASGENLAAAHLMSALESNKFNVPVIAPSKWLKIGVIEYEQFKRHQFYFDYEDYVDVMNESVQEYRITFKNKMNLKPSIYSKNSDAYYGYESMFFFGTMMAKYGNLFNEGLETESYSPNFTFTGMSYQETSANNIAPLYRFNEYYELEWVNYPHFEDIIEHDKNNEE